MDLKRFKIIIPANRISEEIWQEVSKWDTFSRQTVGKQLVRAADSISANLSEAYGRYTFTERKRFCYYARGSLCETINWMEKCINRKLISSERGAYFLAEIQILSSRLFSYMRSLNAH